MTTGRLRIIPTGCSQQVAELRRLLIDPSRWTDVEAAVRTINLNQQERHYLRRVLRRRSGDRVAVIDGMGHLWIATLHGTEELVLESEKQHHLESEAPAQPQIGLAVALIRRGTEDWLRMSCELGIDRFQPLRMERCTPQADYRPERWTSVLREAIEQCERLWMPDLLPLQSIDGWRPERDAQILFAVARNQATTPTLSRWLADRADPMQPIWLVIGPEGGWTEDEISQAIHRGWTAVSMGSTILRTSTAAVRGAVSLLEWRNECEAESKGLTQKSSD